MISFLREHWRPVAAIGVAALAFVAGRLTAPDQPERVVERTEEKVQVQFVDRWHERVIEHEVRVKDTTSQLSRHRELTEVTHPDGLRERKLVEDLNVSKVVKETQIQYVDRVVDRVQTVDKVVEKKVEVQVDAPKKQWLVGPMALVDVTKIGFRDGLNLGVVGVGAQVQRRILGPVWLGAYGVHTGQVGITASWEF